MATKKISDLTAVTTPATTDEFAVMQSGVTRKETTSQLNTALDHGLLTGKSDDDHTQYAKKAGDTFTGGVTGTTLSLSGQLTSTVADGTAPAVVTSGTVVTNLNADKVDGYHAGNGANQVLLLDGSGLVPLADIPATLTGKDADTLDTYHASDLALSGHTHTQKQIFSVVGESNYNPSNSYYVPINGSLAGLSTVELKVAARMPVAGSLVSVSAYIYSNASNGTFTVEIYKNGSATGEVLTINATVTGWQTWTGTVTFAATDTVSLKTINNGGSGAVVLETIVSQYNMTI